MVHRGNYLYSAEDASTRPAFGEVGFTNRNLVRVDRVLEAALEKFQGDPKRVILTSTSYGGRGLYLYAARRPGVFAALVPMAASLYPTPSLARSLCCESGAPECCPAVRHFVGANDRPLMVGGHDAWDREYRSQTRRKTAYAYTKFPWAPPPRQPEYAYMTGHAPERLGVAVAEPVPDAPDVLPGLEAVGVEPGELEVVRVVLGPAVAHVRQPPPVEPLPPIDGRRLGARLAHRLRPVAPAQRLSLIHI